jgi:hypothetical protein
MEYGRVRSLSSGLIFALLGPCLSRILFFIMNYRSFIKMKKIVATFTATVILSLVSAMGAFAATGYSLFGNATFVSPGSGSTHAVRTHSTSYLVDHIYYGGIDFAVPTGLTLADLNTLSTDYKAVDGGCGLGSPRFGASTASGTVYFYIGAPPNYDCPPSNVFVTTGNLAAPTNLVDASQIGGSFYQPYADVQANFGTLAVTDIFLVTDAGYAFDGNQTIVFDNTNVNNVTYNYESPITIDQCKNGGWQTWTRANGTTFKNQGDCIQYVNTGR